MRGQKRRTHGHSYTRRFVINDFSQNLHTWEASSTAVSAQVTLQQYYIDSTNELAPTRHDDNEVRYLTDTCSENAEQCNRGACNVWRRMYQTVGRKCIKHRDDIRHIKLRRAWICILALGNTLGNTNKAKPYVLRVTVTDIENLKAFASSCGN